MTDLKPLSAETLDRWETAARPAITVTFSADDAMSLIAQARRALELEAENADLKAQVEHLKSYTRTHKLNELRDENAALTAALDAAEKALEFYGVSGQDVGLNEWDGQKGEYKNSVLRDGGAIAREALDAIRKHRGEK